MASIFKINKKRINKIKIRNKIKNTFYLRLFYMVSKAEIIKYFHENHLYVNPELVGHVEKLLASSSLESAFKLALNVTLLSFFFLHFRLISLI